MIDSEIFGQNQALEKPPWGKPVKERDFIIMLQEKNQTFIYSQKPTYLNPVKWLSKLPRFLCKAVSFSVQVLLEKRAWKTQQSLPSILCQTAINAALDFCAKSQKSVQYSLQ